MLPWIASVSGLRRLRLRGETTILVAFASLAALALRLAAAQGELWLDEIWSLESAVSLRSPLDIFTRLRHDNNHMLNTAWLWLAGAGCPWIVYRLPAVIAGTVAVVLGGQIVSTAGRVAAATAMLLIGTSYVLVHYSSEARGYGPLMLFVLAAVACLLRFAARPSRDWAAAFGACCSLGFLAHPLFIHFWIASLYWTLVCVVMAAPVEQRAHAVRRAAVCHAVPLMVAVWLWKTHWSVMELGGGPKYSLPGKLVEAASVAAGGPTSGIGAAIAAAILCLAVGWGTFHFRQHRLGTLIAIAAALPILQVVAAPPPFLFVRYFLVAMLLSYLAIAVALGWLYRRGSWGRVSYVVLIAAFLAANTWQIVLLVQRGRGPCRAALAAMASVTESQELTISSDHNFGFRKLIEFYGPVATPSRHWRYINGQEWPSEGPQWLVLHRESDGQPPSFQGQFHIDNLDFQLWRTFDCARFSGWQWGCYRRVTVPD
jgi:hypothetical protein